jgi:hypothetical protein
MIEKQRSVVETELVFDTPSARTTTVETVLIKQGDNWLVDQQLTLARLQGGNEVGAAIAAFRQFTQSFSKELDQSLNELERQAPVIRHELEGIVKKFSDRLPALQKELEGFAKGLDKALQPLVKPVVPPITPKLPSKPPSATDT